MNRETQDKIWALLTDKQRQKERNGYIHPYPSEFQKGYNHARVNFFGQHNLESDSEPEEMLMVELKRVQEYWAEIKKFEPTAEPFDRKAYYQGQLKSLYDFFGDKCLPDKAISKTETTTPIPSNSGELKSETAESERKPKFKVDEIVIAEGLGLVMILQFNPDNRTYMVASPIDGHGKLYTYHEHLLRPYPHAQPESHNLSQNIANCDKPETNPLNDTEEKELNLCELLKDCIYETFYSPICGNCEYKECFEDSEKMLFESIKDGVDGGYASLVFDAEGRYDYYGICMLYPSKELYEKYPLDPRKAWSEWAENRKPKHILQAQIRLISNDGITIEDSEIVEVEVWDISFNHAVKVVERTFEQFHKRKEADQ